MPNHLTPSQLALMDKLYWDGLIDKAVAEMVGCHQTSVCQWRHRTGNPPNDVQGRKPHKWYKISLRATGEVLAHGMMRDCVKQMGKTEKAIRAILCDASRGKTKKYIVEIENI